jgi:hypothetical protein
MGVEEPLPHAAADNRPQAREVRMTALVRPVQDGVRGHQISDSEVQSARQTSSVPLQASEMTIWLLMVIKYDDDKTFCLSCVL